MTLVVERTDEVHPITGRSIFHYSQETPDPNKPLVFTGAAKGTYRLADGRSYNVADDYVECDSYAHAGELSHLIGLDYELNQHPLAKVRGTKAAHPGEVDYDPVSDEYHHVCDWHCGSLARTPEQHLAEWATRLASLEAAGHAVAAEEDGRTADERKQDLVTRLTRQYARHAALKPVNDGRGGATMANAGAAAENGALNGIFGTGSTNTGPDMALHVSTGPSTTGANENANSGSYARQAVSWNSASAGSATNSNTQTFATGGTIAVTYIGLWSSATYAGGTYSIGAALNSSVTAVAIVVASGAAAFTAS